MPILKQNDALASGVNSTSLNEKIDVECIDIPPDDKTLQANTTRNIVRFVGDTVTPRQLVVIMRLVKALTLCALFLTMAANFMFIAFVEIFASRQIKSHFGGFRDLLIRIYGMALALVSVMIEFDTSFISYGFPGLKSFISRSLLLFLISILTTPYSINTTENNSNVYYNYNNNDGNDVLSDQIPHSSVAFQTVTSFFLGICSLSYFALGALCFDRFTKRAYLSNIDPITSTAIPEGRNHSYNVSTAIPQDVDVSYQAPP